MEGLRWADHVLCNGIAALGEAGPDKVNESECVPYIGM